VILATGSTSPGTLIALALMVIVIALAVAVIELCTRPVDEADHA
jgi:hypothetical protein